MRRSLLLALSFVLCAVDLPAQDGARPQDGQQGGQQGGDRQGDGRRRGRRRDRDPASVVLEHVTYQRVTFETQNVPSKSANYGVYLPPGYDDPANADRKYPWVVWLHGMSEDDRDFHFGGAKVLDEQVGSGKLPPLVFVAASAPSRTLYANGETEGNIRDLVTKDLVSDVQTRFRVATTRDQRALMGVSLGGMAALRFAFTDPQLFGSVATHSAAVFPEKLDELDQNYVETVDRFGDRLGWYGVLGKPIDPEKFAAINPTSIARKLGDLHGLRIYFDAGTADRYGFGPANESLHAVLDEKKVAHTFRLIEGGEHSWGGGTVQKSLVDSLQFVAAGFPKAAPGEKSSGEKAPAKSGAGAPGGG